MKLSFLLGSDPELMLVDAKTKKLKSAIPIIVEGKGEGRPLDDTGQNSVLHDNVMLEFNTKPAQSEKEFISNTNFVMRRLFEVLAPHKVEPVVRASANFPKDALDCNEAKIFGCDPDYNAWTLRPIEMDPDAPLSSFRSAGGHLHIGKHKTSKLNQILDDPFGKVNVVKAMDIVCGVTSILFDNDPTSPARRKLYGQCGAHRPKDYGVEYRSLGNGWLSSPDHTLAIYRLTYHALRLVTSDKLNSVIKTLGGDESCADLIQITMNTSDKKTAKSIFDKHISKLIDKDTVKLVGLLSRRKKMDLKKAWKL